MSDLTGLDEDNALAYVRAAQARGQRVCGRAETRDGRLVFVAAAALVAAALGGCSASMDDPAMEEGVPSSPAAAAAPVAECEGGACGRNEMMMGDVDLAQ